MFLQVAVRRCVSGGASLLSRPVAPSLWRTRSLVPPRATYRSLGRLYATSHNANTTDKPPAQTPPSPSPSSTQSIFSTADDIDINKLLAQEEDTNDLEADADTEERLLSSLPPQLRSVFKGAGVEAILRYKSTGEFFDRNSIHDQEVLEIGRRYNLVDQEGRWKDESAYVNTPVHDTDVVPTSTEEFATADDADPNYHTFMDYMKGNERDLRKMYFKEKPPSLPSRMYYLSKEDVSRYLPEGPAGDIRKHEWAEFPETNRGVIVRPECHQIVDWMEKRREEHFIPQGQDSSYYMLLDGPAGAGKSCMLNPLAHWARMEGWLVVLIPDGNAWISTGNIKRSNVLPTSYEQPLLAMELCRWQIKAHADQYRTIPLRTTPDMQDFSAEGKTILDLLEHGVKDENFATDVVYHFRRELNCITEFPVAILVDGVNVMNKEETIYLDPLDPRMMPSPLPASRLVLSRLFGDPKNHGLANGIFVGTTTRRDRSDTFDENMEANRKSMHISEVPYMSREQFHLLAEYYSSAGQLEERMPTETVDYLWSASSGMGTEFWRQTRLM